jgi:hypothetical protein
MIWRSQGDFSSSLSNGKIQRTLALEAIAWSEIKETSAQVVELV